MSESAASGVRDALARRRTILKILAIPASVIILVVSVLLAGATSHANPTGSVAGVEKAVAEDARLNGIDPSAVQIAGTISTVNNHWARFEVGPAAGANPTGFAGYYGFATFEPHGGGWVIVASGTARVGCATAAASGVVPLVVIEGFGLSCPAG
jgi:hypothetical protein